MMRWLLLLLPLQALAAPFQVGVPGMVYIDPEFEPGGSRMVFQDIQRRAWVGALNPDTGQCVSASCRDLVVATDLHTPAAPELLFNGPEWGVDAGDSAIYLTKYWQQSPQVWRVLPDGSALARLTSAQGGVYSQLVSVAPQAQSVRLLAGTGSPAPQPVWFDEIIGELNPIPNWWLMGKSASFVAGSEQFAVFPWKSGQDYQIGLLDTYTNTAQAMTADSGQKSQVWAWGDRAAAVVDSVVIAVYDTTQTPWGRIAELVPPIAGWLASLEPVGESGCFVVSVQNAPNGSYTEAAIYLACLPGQWTRLDDGSPKRRSEPEPWNSPAGKWFVYWNEGAALFATALS